MSAINQLNTPAKEKALSIYETNLLEGEVKQKFKVFQNGIQMGLPLDTLIKLTNLPLKLAKEWQELILKDPKAQFPDH